jgi:hypothetical protein
VLTWSDSTLAMLPLMEDRGAEIDPRVFRRGLYALTIPLDIAMSHFYLVGGIGFLFLLGAGHGFGPGFH